MLRAARYLRVPPWELASRPVWWLNIALAAELAESKAQDRQQKKRREATPNADRRPA